ncbi:ABC transporter ATP-binding protein [Pseudomonas sp. NPDC088444]|uniref:ABC transporter ATP-binding protein n=1 Tax=Pseudomonas sp. NPDC088444 TaxID=3364456 RepID=UPI0038516E95
MTPCLTVRNLTVNYGPLRAVHGLSLDIAPSELVFLAGPNGAGKSSMMRALAGAVRAAGTVYIQGQPTLGLTPDKIVATGFTLVPEGRDIFGSLSVEENLRLGAYLRKDRFQIDEDFEFVLDELPALKSRLADPACLLCGGQQQMLTIGRALMTRAKLIAIDEPSLGLAPKVIDQIYEVLMGLRQKRGLTLLIAEQSFNRAIELDARLLMISGGRVVKEGAARELAQNGALEDSYFGAEEIAPCS